MVARACETASGESLCRLQTMAGWLEVRRGRYAVGARHFRSALLTYAQAELHDEWLRQRLLQAASSLAMEMLDFDVLRGLDVEQGMLFVIDGSKGLRKAIHQVFGNDVPVQRCVQHKQRNVLDHLPESVRPRVRRILAAAWEMSDAALAERRLRALAGSLERAHPGAAGSLLEGLAETLTVNRLGVPPTLARTLRSTNAIESMIEICRDHSSNVKRWRDGQMALRWCAAGMHEAAKQFRRVNGHLHLAALRTALDAHFETVTPARETQEAA